MALRGSLPRTARCSCKSQHSSASDSPPVDGGSKQSQNPKTLFQTSNVAEIFAIALLLLPKTRMNRNLTRRSGLIFLCRVSFRHSLFWTSRAHPMKVLVLAVLLASLALAFASKRVRFSLTSSSSPTGQLSAARLCPDLP